MTPNSVIFFFSFAGLQVAVVAMASSAWEVRNAASLIFTALLIRMLGFRNLVKVHNHTLPPRPAPSPAPFLPSNPPCPSICIAPSSCKLGFGFLSQSHRTMLKTLLHFAGD